MITMADVARAASTSKYTVSCSLRGVGSVSSATRQRVLEVANRLGYQLNGPASLLARQQNRRRESLRQIPVALLGFRPGSTPDWSPMFSRACQALGLIATSMNVELPNAAAALKTIWSQGIEGIFLLPPETESGRSLSQLDWSRFCVVKEQRTQPELRFHLIRHSAFDFVYEALSQVAARGYKRIAFLTFETSVRRDNLARIGAAVAFQKFDLPDSAKLVWQQISSTECDWSRPLPDRLRRWIDRFAPDAIVVFPVSFCRLLLAAGYGVPQDFGVASVYVTPGALGWKEMAGCHSGYDEIARRAASRLHVLLQSNEKGMCAHPLEEVIEPVWLDGASLPDRGGNP